MAPCDWPISYIACASCPKLAGMSAEDQALIEATAVEYLWNWTLGAFGLCPVTVRPCRKDCFEGESSFFGGGPYPRGGGWPNPQLVGGEWTNVSCGFCKDDCSCGGSSLATLKLPGPIASVTQILIDGVVLAPGSYRIDNGTMLVRLDGGAWPTCQDMTLATTEAGTFEISYVRGRPVPTGGQIAAGILACELAKAICRDGSCALPQRVQTITRQGVTMAMIDNGEGIQKGQTGIWAIDSWVSSITSPARASTVMSPDFGRSPRFRTTT